MRLDTRLSIALLAFSTLAAAQEDTSTVPIATLLVYNKAQAPATTITKAEREAGRILGEAGVGAVWVDCLDRHPSADPQRLCGKAREPSDVVLRVLPGQPRIGSRTPSSVSPSFRLSPVSTTNMRCVSRTVTRRSPQFWAAPSHTKSAICCSNRTAILRGGLCSGVWGAKELHLALMGRLLFTSQQSKLIRAETRRRMSLQIGTLRGKRLATVDQRAEQ